MTKDRNGLQRRGKWLQFDLQDRSTSVWLGGNGNGSKRTRADRLNKDVVACCCCTASFCWYLISLIHFVLFSTFLVPLLTWSGFVALRIFSQHITAYIWNIYTNIYKYCIATHTHSRVAHAQTRVSPQFLHIFRPLIYWSIFPDYSLHWKEYCRLLLSSSSVSVWVCQSSVGQLLSLRVTESFFLLFTSHFPSFLLSISLSLSNVRSGGVIACFPPFQLIQIIVFIQYSLPYTKTSCCTQWNVVQWWKKTLYLGVE